MGNTYETTFHRTIFNDEPMSRTEALTHFSIQSLSMLLVTRKDGDK